MKSASSTLSDGRDKDIAMELVFATNNAHKLAEMRQIVGDRFKILSLSDIGCNEDIPETQPTLEGNARQKAEYIHEHYGRNCFADDTGLEVTALDGAPGVFSARYAGAGHDSKANMRKLLAEMEGVADRSARFRTVMALIVDGKLYTAEGIVEGLITEEGAGTDGFGYDPVFRPAGWHKTFAEASPEEKNAVSHRGRAAENLLKILNTLK